MWDGYQIYQTAKECFAIRDSCFHKTSFFCPRNVHTFWEKAENCCSWLQESDSDNIMKPNFNEELEQVNAQYIWGTARRQYATEWRLIGSQMSQKASRRQPGSLQPGATILHYYYYKCDNTKTKTSLFCTMFCQSYQSCWLFRAKFSV